MTNEHELIAFDQELDRLALGTPGNRGADAGLAEMLTVATDLQRRYDAQVARPSGAFVDELRSRLIANEPVAALVPEPTGTTTHRWVLPVLPEVRPGGLGSRPAFVPAAMAGFVAAALCLVALLTWRALDAPSSPMILAPTVSNEMASFDSGEITGQPLLWQMANSEVDSPYFRTVAVSGNTVYRVVDSPPDFNGVEAIDGRTGETIWRVEHSLPSLVGIRANQQGAYILEAFFEGSAGDALSRVTAVAAEDGAELWSIELTGIPLTWSVQDGVIYISDDQNVTRAIDSTDGEGIWEYLALAGTAEEVPVAYLSVQNSVPLVFGDIVVSFTRAGQVVGLDKQTGAERWIRDDVHPQATRFAAAGDVLTSITFVAGADSDGILETDIGKVDGEDDALLLIARVSAIDPIDGSELWARFISSQSLEIAATDGVVAYIGSQPPFASVRQGTPNPTEHEGESVETPLLGERLDQAIGLDPVTGELLWIVNAGETYFSTLSTWTPPSGVGGGIVATTSDRTLRPIGFWREGKLAVPDTKMSLYPRPISGDFGFVVVLENGDLAGVAVNAVPEGLAQATPEAGPAVLWTSPGELQEIEDIAFFAVNDDAVFRFTLIDGFTGIEALDGQTGRQLWKEEQQWALVQPVADDAHLYYARYAASLGVMTIVALDASTGHVAWTVAPDRTVMGLTAANGVLYAEVSPNTLMAIRDGEILWESAIDPYVDPVSSNEIMLHMHGPVVTTVMVVAMAANGTIAGFDPVDGARLWTSVRTPGPGSEYVVAGDVLVRFSPLLIEAPVSLQSTPPPDVPIRSEIVGADLDDDAATLWRHEMDAYAYPVGVVGDMVYFIEFNVQYVPATPAPDRSYLDAAIGKLFALDAQTGEIRTIEIRTGPSSFTSGAVWSPSNGDEPLVLVGAADGALTFFDPVDQSRLDILQAGPVDGVVVDIQINNDVAYLLLDDGSVVAVSLADESP